MSVGNFASMKSIARVRPLLPGEAGPEIWTCNSLENSLQQVNDSVNRRYLFDHVFGTDTTTTDLYQVYLSSLPGA